MDDFVQKLSAETSPETYLTDHRSPSVIDDISPDSNLLTAIEVSVDSSDARGQYWLATSLCFPKMNEGSATSSENLVHFNLYPFSVYERLALGLEQKPFCPSLACYDNPMLPSMKASDIWEMIYRGAWPSIAHESNPKMLLTFYKDLLEEITLRDIRQLCHLTVNKTYLNFLKVLAICSGQELQINRLAKHSGVCMPTAQRWLQISQACGLVYLLPGLDLNTGKQTVKRPKIYLTDTGLIAYLLKIDSSMAMSQHPLANRFFENFVVMEILKSWRHNGKDANLFHYRNNK